MAFVLILFMSSGDFGFFSGVTEKSIPSLFLISTFPSSPAFFRSDANCCRASEYVYTVITTLTGKYILIVYFIEGIV